MSVRVWGWSACVDWSACVRKSAFVSRSAFVCVYNQLYGALTNSVQIKLAFWGFTFYGASTTPCLVTLSLRHQARGSMRNRHGATYTGQCINQCIKVLAVLQMYSITTGSIQHWLHNRKKTSVNILLKCLNWFWICLYILHRDFAIELFAVGGSYRNRNIFFAAVSDFISPSCNYSTSHNLLWGNWFEGHRCRCFSAFYISLILY